MGKYAELIRAINIIDPVSRETALEIYEGDCSMRNAAIEWASRRVADYARICQLVFAGEKEALFARGMGIMYQAAWDYFWMLESMAGRGGGA